MIGEALPAREQDSPGRMFDPINDACQLDGSSSQHQGVETLPQRTKKKAQKMPRDLNANVEPVGDTHPAHMPSEAPPLEIAPPPPTLPPRASAPPDAVAKRSVAPPPPPRQKQNSEPTATSQSCALQRDVAPPPPPPPPQRHKVVSPPPAPAHNPRMVQAESPLSIDEDEAQPVNTEAFLSQEWQSYQNADKALESEDIAQVDLSGELLQSNASTEKDENELLQGDGQWQAGKNEISKFDAPRQHLEKAQSEASTSTATEEIFVVEEATHDTGAPACVELPLVVENVGVDIQNENDDIPRPSPSLMHEQTNETSQFSLSPQLAKSEAASERSQIDVSDSFGAESQQVVQSEAQHEDLDSEMTLPRHSEQHTVPEEDVAQLQEASAPLAINMDIGSQHDCGDVAEQTLSMEGSDLNHNELPSLEVTGCALVESTEEAYIDAWLPPNDFVDVACLAEGCTDTIEFGAFGEASPMMLSAEVDDIDVAPNRDSLGSIYETPSGSPEDTSNNYEDGSESPTLIPLDLAPPAIGNDNGLADYKHDGIASCDEEDTSVPLDVELLLPGPQEDALHEFVEAAENTLDIAPPPPTTGNEDVARATSTPENVCWGATPKPPPAVKTPPPAALCSRLPAESTPSIETPLPPPPPPRDNINASPCAYGDIRLRGIVPPPPAKRRGDVPGPPATQITETQVAPPPPKKPPPHANESAAGRRAENQAKPSPPVLSETAKPKALVNVASTQRSETTVRVGGDDTNYDSRLIARTEAYTPQYSSNANPPSQLSGWRAFDQACTTKTSRNGNYVEINLSGRKLDDAGLSDWCRWAEQAFLKLGICCSSADEVSMHYLILNLAENWITDWGMEELCCFLAGSTGLRLRQLRLHKNYLGKGSAISLARLIGALGARAGTENRAALEELHLSHNKLGVEGIRTLLHSVAAAWGDDANKPLYPLTIPCGSTYYYKPLWLRVEYNGQERVEPGEFIEKVTPELRQKREQLGWLQSPSDSIPMLCLGKDVHKCTLNWCYQQCGDQGPVLHVACWGGERAQHDPKCAPRQTDSWSGRQDPRYTTQDRHQQYSNRHAGRSSSYARPDPRYTSNDQWHSNRQGSSYTANAPGSSYTTSARSSWQQLQGHEQWQSQEAPPRTEAPDPPLPPGPPPRSRENQLGEGAQVWSV